MKQYNMLASCLFGVEGLLADELKRLNFTNVQSENGRVFFCGDAQGVARANLWLRTAERVLLVVGRFEATNFEELFQGIKALPWEEFLLSTDAFPVIGYSLDSALHSIPDCQSIIKKAIVERLKRKYRLDWFAETGPLHKIRFSIQKNQVVVGIDTSGEGLYKRGYRAHSLEAPIKETLAASMCYLARIYPDTRLYDPFCGSGTILIEAAMMAKNMAPGLRRHFAAERFSKEFADAFSKERTEALNQVKSGVEFHAFGSDIDAAAVSLAKENAKKAGVSDLISVSLADFADFQMPKDRSIVITNPPYGERLLDIQKAEKIYGMMGEKMPQEFGKKYFVICPNDDFEDRFGRPADKRRKLYNGMIRCQLFSYFRNPKG